MIHSPQTIVEAVIDQLRDLGDSRVQIALMLWKDDDERGPYAGAFGNQSGVADMVHALLKVITDKPRDEECGCCGGAWDAMVEARILLDPANREHGPHK